MDEPVAVPVEVPRAPARECAAVVAAGLSVIIETEPVAVAVAAEASVETGAVEVIDELLAALTSTLIVTPWPWQRAEAT